jgi:hypothetical protein
MVSGIPGVYSTSTGLERSRMGDKGVRRTQVPCESRCRVPDFCHSVLILSPATGNIVLVLADLPDGKEEDQETRNSVGRIYGNRCGRRPESCCRGSYSRGSG